MSSASSYTHRTRAVIYAATKSYNKALSDVLYKEVGDAIDVMAVLPGPTKSNMVKFNAPFVIKPEQHVRWALSDLGYNKQTFGHYKHWIHTNGYRLPLFDAWYTAMKEKSISQSQ